MITAIEIIPDHSLVLLMDKTVGDIPDSMDGTLVSCTRTCVAIGTKAELDGNTSVTLSDEIPSNLPKGGPVFDGAVETPSKQISVCSVMLESLLDFCVRESCTRVRIWVNHATEPDEIWIVLG